MKSLLKYFFLFISCNAVLSGFAQTGSEAKRKYDQADKFVEVMNLVRSYYTDTVDDEKLVEDAIARHTNCINL